jgi:hypothetical protein
LNPILITKKDQLAILTVSNRGCILLLNENWGKWSLSEYATTNGEENVVCQKIFDVGTKY